MQQRYETMWAGRCACGFHSDTTCGHSQKALKGLWCGITFWVCLGRWSACCNVCWSHTTTHHWYSHDHGECSLCNRQPNPTSAPRLTSFTSEIHPRTDYQTSDQNICGDSWGFFHHRSIDVFLKNKSMKTSGIQAESDFLSQSSWFSNIYVWTAKGTWFRLTQGWILYQSAHTAGATSKYLQLVDFISPPSLATYRTLRKLLML